MRARVPLPTLTVGGVTIAFRSVSLFLALQRGFDHRVGARALCASVVTTLAPGTSTARTSVAEVGVGLVALRDVVATSRSTCGSATGNVTIGALTVASLPVTVTTAPNTTILLPGGKVVINEQVPTLGGLKANGARIILSGVDLVVSAATSAIHNC